MSGTSGASGPDAAFVMTLQTFAAVIFGPMLANAIARDLSALRAAEIPRPDPI
ncbi:hypothetical protein [Paenirhodobacter sp.]|uniref:hypothetical protein n=1 Tax=Paenirhodobacter sp. TaxID=1965326 RepID=UPI003B3ED334